MPPRNLPERVAFDKRQAVTDDYGVTSGDFQEQFIVPAGYVFLMGGEGVQAARLAGTQPVVIRVRESTQTRLIEPAWRARDARSGVTYNVKSVMPAPGSRPHTYLDVLATAGEAQ